MNVGDMAAMLAKQLRATDGVELFPALLKLLAEGRPVAASELAARTGRDAEAVEEALDRLQVERDAQGRVVGAGISLVETPHAFEVNGRRLYTWCALDALIFPALLGTEARVSSRCPATGRDIRMTVSADGVRDLDPPGAVVSFVLGDVGSDIRGLFCCQVSFFASKEAAEPWRARHSANAVLPVAEAHGIGVELARQLLDAGIMQVAPCCR